MNKVLLPLAVAALIALPASAQPGPGGPPEPQATPAAVPQHQPGPGFGFEGSATPATAAPAASAAKPAAPKVYDEAADARADVAAAVAKAKTEKKRVLVTLGANWCSWCRSLDKTFTTDEKVAAALAKSYVPLKVNVGRMKKGVDRNVDASLDLAASWGADPATGIPLLVVLDGSGKAVKVQETEVLEAGKGHDPAKVIAFLEANSGR